MAVVRRRPDIIRALDAAFPDIVLSTIADVKNVGDRWGGAITAGLFLREFVDDTPWCHLDVAGTAFHEKAGDYWPKGATGSPARTVIRYVLDRAADGSGAASKRSGSGAKRSAKPARSRPRARART